MAVTARPRPLPRHLGATALTSAEVDRVRAVLFLSGLRGHDIDDAAQEVQLRTLERAPDDLQSAGTWATVVAANLARDWHRRAGRSVTVQARLTALAPAETSEPDLALKVAIGAGLVRLEPDLREAVVLRFYGDLPVRDIAALLNVPEGTVKSRLHRAVTVMRELLPKESVT